MSSNLYWRPAPEDEPEPTRLPVDLKKRIARRFWDHDGSLNGDQITVGSEITLYLDGLADARSRGRG